MTLMTTTAAMAHIWKKLVLIATSLSKKVDAFTKSYMGASWQQGRLMSFLQHINLSAIVRMNVHRS